MKRDGPGTHFAYSADPALSVWMPLDRAGGINSFATRAEAYAAIGRYVEALVTGGRDDSGMFYTNGDIGRLVRLRVVEIEPPKPDVWVER